MSAPIISLRFANGEDKLSLRKARWTLDDLIKKVSETELLIEKLTTAIEERDAAIRLLEQAAEPQA